jgi:hypothetical protein
VDRLDQFERGERKTRDRRAPKITAQVDIGARDERR